jgi:hypothetical protein
VKPATERHVTAAALRQPMARIASTPYARFLGVNPQAAEADADAAVPPPEAA